MGNFHQPIPGEGSKVDPHFVSLHYLHVLEKVQIIEIWYMFIITNNYFGHFYAYTCIFWNISKRLEMIKITSVLMK